MAPRRLSPRSSLDHLKKEGKRWLRALRDGDREARARFESAHPSPPADPALRDVQLALAREYGHSGWVALREAVAALKREEARVDAALVRRFLHYATPDHHIRGRSAHRMARHAAMRLLRQHPEIATANLATAVVCGELDLVRRMLDQRPELAKAKAGTSPPQRTGAGGEDDVFRDIGDKGWEPLLFLAFTRLDHPSIENATAMATLLLDRGADPNAFFMAGDSVYTPLTGVAGEGEEDRPPHPRRDELARLFMERGANPYDIQVVYDLGFHGKVLWYLDLAYDFSVRAGRRADWDDPEWRMLDMGGYGSGARWHLDIAVKRNDAELAEWCLTHGASPEAAPASDPRFVQRSLYESAVIAGSHDVAALLLEHGAKRVDVKLDDENALVAASLNLDRERVSQILERRPDLLHSTKPIFEAARRDRDDVVALLLGLGVPVEVEDAQKNRPLHIAASRNALRAARLLIEHGAEIDPVETNWGNTPLDYAVYHEHPAMIELLTPHSRDVWNLTFVGAVERLRQLLAENPERARVSWQTTPLFWLPEDERAAMEIVRLFVANGADPAFRHTKEGTTAADVARRRGMREVAELLETLSGPSSATPRLSAWPPSS